MVCKIEVGSQSIITVSIFLTRALFNTIPTNSTFVLSCIKI